jgi:hypothetical protein
VNEPPKSPRNERLGASPRSERGSQKRRYTETDDFAVLVSRSGEPFLSEAAGIFRMDSRGAIGLVVLVVIL